MGEFTPKFWWGTPELHFALKVGVSPYEGTFVSNVLKVLPSNEIHCMKLGV